jgi:hypothetical protein
LKTSDSERMKLIATKAESEGEGDPGLTIVAILKMLEALGNETKACRRASPVPY